MTKREVAFDVPVVLKDDEVDAKEAHAEGPVEGGGISVMEIPNAKKFKHTLDSDEESDDERSVKYPLRQVEVDKESISLSSFASCSKASSSNICGSTKWAHGAKSPEGLEEWLKTFHSWSHPERLLSLDRLVTSEICDVHQIRFLLGLIEPQLQRDFISLLPKELALYVLSFLEPKDLLRAAQICRYWRILCEDNLLWREKCREEGLPDDLETLLGRIRRRFSSRHANYHQARHPLHGQLHSPSLSSAGPSARSSEPQGSAFVPSEYKLGYLRQRAIESNWRYGRFPNDSEAAQPNPVAALASAAVAGAAAANPAAIATSSSTTLGVKGRYLKEILQLKGHDDHVITCLQFNPDSNLIVSGSDDNTLKVWSSKSGQCLRTLTGHTGGVWSSQLSPSDIVISGSTDRTLKVWNANSGDLLHTLFGHTSTVRCMALNGDRVVSGSRDATLRVWDLVNGSCCHVLVGHVAAVRCVQYNGNKVVSGAYDYLVKVWDVETETCIHTLEGHTNRVYSLQFDGESIISGSLDTSIRVWSSSTGTLKHTLVGHQSLTSGMQLRGNILVSGNADSTVKVWDISTGQCLQTLAGAHKHQSAVTCLQFNSRFVITSSDDGTVKLWDLKSGEFVRNLVSLSSGGSGGVVWRIRASNTTLVCAVGSRNGTEETKLLVLDFDTETEPESSPFPPLSLPPASSSNVCIVYGDSEDDDDFLMDQGSSSSSPAAALDAFICDEN